MIAPSKQEILEKYRHLIDDDDFQVLVSEELPSPSELQREGAWLQKLGTLDGLWVFAKRNAWGAVLSVIVFVANYGDFFQGLETMRGHAVIALDSVKSALAKGTERPDVPADEYLVAVPPEYSTWIAGPTTTTTTTPPPEPPLTDLPSGSGLVPYSSAWGSIG